MKTFVFCVLLSTFMLTCQQPTTPLERDAYNVVVAGKASLVSFRAAHPECRFDAKSGLSSVTSNSFCVANNKLTSAKDLVIDAAEVYCSSTNFENGGTCNPPAAGTTAFTQAAAKLQAAVAGYKQSATDLKGIIQ